MADELTETKPKTFQDFYIKVKDRVIKLVTEQEIAEGNISFEKIAGDVLKEMIFTDGDINRKQIIPRDTQNYPIKNIIYRVDSKQKATKKRLRIK